LVGHDPEADGEWDSGIQEGQGGGDLRRGKVSISGAADMAGLTIPEMVEHLVSRGYRSGYSLENFRRGVTLLEERLKEE
jgi:hypothetical protein